MPPLLRLSVCPLVFVAGEFGERKHRFVVTAPGLSCPALLPGSQGRRRRCWWGCCPWAGGSAALRWAPGCAESTGLCVARWVWGGWLGLAVPMDGNAWRGRAAEMSRGAGGSAALCHDAAALGTCCRAGRGQGLSSPSCQAPFLQLCPLGWACWQGAER